MTVLWKGIGSALIVKGLTLAVEDVLSKITPWPKSVLFSNIFYLKLVIKFYLFIFTQRN